MIYAMSDLHGCFEKYSKMLLMIDLKENDTLYILGDIVDRGADGIKIILDLVTRKNVIALQGNHDNKAELMLNRLMESEEATVKIKIDKQFAFWISDGGLPTYESFLRLERQEKLMVLNYLRKMPFSKMLIIDGKKYFLSHTVPEKEYMPENPEQCRRKALILGEPDYEETYFKDITLVTGHTPTILIDKHFQGKIWRGNNHIAIDCGAAFGNNLGCICLDTGEEFYVE